jgi:hypothetical protein
VLAFCSAVFIALISMCCLHDSTHVAAVECYEAVKLYLMHGANSLAWWSLLGLLNSACCLLQILLNALSLGT